MPEAPPLIYWHLLSTKSPSIKSSIGSYTLLLGQGLASAGQQVALWHSRTSLPPPPLASQVLAEQSPGGEGPSPAAAPTGSLVGRHLPARWDHRTLSKLSLAFDQSPAPRRIFLQFDPGLLARVWNVRLASWLQERKAKGDEIWLMLHKVFEPYTARGRLFAGLQAYLQRRMLAAILATTDRVFVPTPYWQAWVDPLAEFPREQLTWLPMPSNVVWVENEQRAKNLRKAFAPQAKFVLGTFGSYHKSSLAEHLNTLLPQLLNQHAERVWLCLGRGSVEFARKMRRKYPRLAQQIATTGELDTIALSAHIQACDLMLQPYLHGVNTSRSSIMVGLAHGRPIVTSLGPRTEGIWASSACVKLTPQHDLAAMATAAEALLADAKGRKALGACARATYREHFSLERCLATLLASPP